MVWIRVVLEAAKTAKNLPLRVEAVDEAREYCLKNRLIARSKRRERRPTNEELQKLDQYYQVRDRHKCTVVPMRCMMWFANSACAVIVDNQQLHRAQRRATIRQGKLAFRILERQCSRNRERPSVSSLTSCLGVSDLTIVAAEDVRR